MSLNRVLELSEANMNEGDYLEVANILRDVHNNTPPPPTDMERLIILNRVALSCECSCGDCDDLRERIRIDNIKITRAHIYSELWRLDEISIDGNAIKLNRLQAVLRMKLSSFMKFRWELKAEISTETTIYNFDDYSKFCEERYVVRWGDHDYDYDAEDVYKMYIKFIVEQVIEYLNSLSSI